MHLGPNKRDADNLCIKKEAASMNSKENEQTRNQQGGPEERDWKGKKNPQRKKDRLREV